MIKRYTILILMLITMIIVIILVFNERNEKANFSIVKEESNSNGKENVIQYTDDNKTKKSTFKNNDGSKREDLDSLCNIKVYKWDEIGLQPEKTLEGEYYTFTAFEVINNKIVLTGNTNGENFLKFINEDKISTLFLDDTPLDLLYAGNELYVLCLRSLFIIKNEKIAEKISIDIPQITLYDKLIFFDNTLNILMADGTAYKKTGNNMIKTSALESKENVGIWVKKTSSNSFEIRTKPNDANLNKKANFKTEIGSVTLIGNSSENYFCIIDLINRNELKIERGIISSEDNFNKIIYFLPAQDFSYIKNDIKIHDNTLYSVKVERNGITLEKFILQ